jgi:16S rRNA processing protein RimM
VGDRSYEVVDRRGTEHDPLLRLAGVDDRDGALALRGREIRVDAEQAPTLGDGEWWAHELVGCVIHDGEIEVGTVIGLLELPSCEALEVKRARGHMDPLLVPMVKDAIRSVDIRARRIDIDLSFLGEGA